MLCAVLRLRCIVCLLHVVLRSGVDVFVVVAVVVFMCFFDLCVVYAVLFVALAFMLLVFYVVCVLIVCVCCVLLPFVSVFCYVL